MLRTKSIHFLWRKSVFYGFVFPREGCNQTPGNVKIKTWSLPLYTRTGVQNVLSLASCYCNFIPVFAHIAVPLTGLLRNEKQRIWTEAEQTVAKTLMGCLASSPVFALSDFNKPLSFSQQRQVIQQLGLYSSIRWVLPKSIRLVHATLNASYRGSRGSLRARSSTRLGGV